MISYPQILKTSYRVTVQNPALWLFGLFVAGGFNLNFLYLYQTPLRGLLERADLKSLLDFFYSRPEALAGFIVLVLLFFISLLVLTSWCRTVLILGASSVLKKDRLMLAKQMKDSRNFLERVFIVTLLTSVLMVLVAAGLLGAPFFLVKDQAHQAQLWTAGLVFLIPLAFTISGINIFTGFFTVIYDQGVKKALNLATDLFIVHWPKVLGLSVVLMVVYSAAFAGGAGLIYLIRAVLDFLISWLNHLPFSGMSFMLIPIQALAGIFLWLVLAGLNVFFNTALLILFLQLTAPTGDDKEKSESVVPLPASSSA